MPDDLKYGQVTLERGSLHEGEPVFVLRGQDPLAYLAIRQYRALCIAAGCDSEHVDTIKEAAHFLKQWQEDNPDKVKDKPGANGKLP